MLLKVWLNCICHCKGNQHIQVDIHKSMGPPDLVTAANEGHSTPVTIVNKAGG